MRKLFLSVGAMALTGLPGWLCAQSQSDRKDPLAFEVASVKKSAGDRNTSIHPMSANQGYQADSAWLTLLMTVAYQVTDRQITGGPSWVNTERFDIEAKAARPGASDELRVMLQHLLEERFHLTLRRETREQAVYALVVDKGGPKMPTHNPEDKEGSPLAIRVVKNADGPECRSYLGRNVTMSNFAFFLSRLLDRNVINRTNLPAAYDVNVPSVQDYSVPGRVDPNSVGCDDSFSALPKYLGLRLDSVKSPLEYLVIERAEKPAEN